MQLVHDLLQRIGCRLSLFRCQIPAKDKLRFRKTVHPVITQNIFLHGMRGHTNMSACIMKMPQKLPHALKGLRRMGTNLFDPVICLELHFLLGKMEDIIAITRKSRVKIIPEIIICRQSSCRLRTKNSQRIQKCRKVHRHGTVYNRVIMIQNQALILQTIPHIIRSRNPDMHVLPCKDAPFRLPQPHAPDVSNNPLTLQRSQT